MSRKTKQVLFLLLTVVLATIVGGSLYLYFWLKNSVPVRDGTVSVSGINETIEITFDKMGIPQIWSKTAPDGYFALGYLHASDRLFQMDMSRRMSQGRLSELLGTVTLELDKKQKRIGHNRIAAQALVTLDETYRQRLQAYADGVNGYAKTAGAPPFEYLLLGAAFEEWTVFDCLTLLSFQTWYSDALQNHDQFYLELKEKIGREKAASLCYTYPDWAPVTIPDAEKIGQSTPVSEFDFVSPFNTNAIEPYLMSNSSNAFVVGPNKSAGGHAILASDPHLPINQLPQFWYMVGLHIQEDSINVLGISAPGLPYIVMGHNGRTGWAFTAGGIDVSDFYSEKINPEDSGQYQTPSGWKQFEYVTDTIIANGLDSPIVLTTSITRHGPVLIETNDTIVQSFRWAGYDADLNLAVGSGFAMHGVKDFKEFQKAVTNMGALNANWIYADANGNIGYQLGTPLPIKPFKSDCHTKLGWSDDYEWQGYVSLSKTPQSLNPHRNWLANSNNLSTRSPEFPMLSGSFAADRIIRITQLMSQANEISADDCRRFQFDRTDAYLLRWRWDMARQLVGLGHHELSDLINNWDGSTGLDSKETALTMLFLTQLKQLTFEDELGEMYQGVRTIWLDEVFHNKSFHFWFDDINTDTVEALDDISRRAMSNAVEIVAQKTWKDFNSLSMRHPMSEVPVIGSLLELNRGVWPWPGSAGTLNASFIVPAEDTAFQTIVGPSWRMVVDFADVDAASFVIPAGNSGNPMSPHFFDFNHMWQEGRYWNIPISEERVKKSAASVLILQPAVTSAKN